MNSSSTTNVVLVHGAFADGSGWRPVHERLTSRGYRVTIVQNPLTSFEEPLRERASGPVAALDRPRPVGPGLRVLQHRGVAGLVGGEPTRAQQLLLVVDDLDGR